MLRRITLRFLSVLLILASSAMGQDQPANDPEALSMASQALTALTSGVAITDVTFTGSATWIAGSDRETGTFTMRAKGNGEARVDLNLSGGNRSDIRNNSPYPQGESIAADGSTLPYALHNCWTDASWFFPALSSLNIAGSANSVLSYVGAENRNGTSVQHLQFYYYLTGGNSTALQLAQAASQTDVYLDASSFLPVSVTSTTHPDDDAGTNIPVEIDFSGYQSVSGIQVPGHIQKFLQGSLQLDLVVSSSVFNSGLLDSIFAIQ